MFVVNGKEQTEVQEAMAGDVVAIPKLKQTGVNDSLCAAGQAIALSPIAFPNPVTSYAVYVKKKGEEDQLASGLQRVADDDPTLVIERNEQTHEIVISGLGDIQLEMCVQQLKKRGNVEVDLRTPQVAYQETITGQGEGHYRHKKQSGGRGQFGEVYLRVEPLTEGDEEWFVNAIVGGAIPGNFMPGVEKGLVEGRQQGSLAGYPVQNVKITVYDGKHHDVDSSEIAFKIAASRALREGMSAAKPVLLEPIMKLEVMVPEQFMGDVTGDINHKRGRILGMDSKDGMQIMTAEAPQAELFRYSSELRSMTGGRGSFEMEFVRYDAVPANVAQKIIAEARRDEEEED
jgi:elongation factor G